QGVYTWVADESGILRFSGYSYSPNEMGELMLATVGVGLVLWPRFHGWKRFGIATVIIASIAFATMADSRSPFLALMIASLCYLVWKYRGRGIAICLVLAIVGYVAVTTWGIGTGTSFTRDISTLTGRTTAWNFELSKVMEHPFWGFGYSVEGAIFQDRQFPMWE